MSTATPGAVTKLTTADEFWEFVHRPEHESRSFHLIRGTVVEDARPERPHGVVVARLGSFLEEYARHVRFGYVVTASGVILARNPATVLGPDVAYFTDANKFEDMHPKWGEVPPVLAVEISSPNDRPGRMNAKIQEYLTNGVKVVWQIDYEERNVTVYRPNKTMEVVRESDELTGGDDLPGLVIKVADIFKLPGDRHPPPPTSPPPAT
ncbi:Uma2 family endonuclease [Gemmata sp. G18]|uniref:Uma2 family endonuclease n=1 Tax=Gemmata palustris TaxID=2822762 RepID=A0ABS5BTI3_9BACT|nr:Uma2 family endonuclease [Gemmata palustris]MBP3956966.1 Uma2 family endonuclease [Gemmata palustris]